MSASQSTSERRGIDGSSNDNTSERKGEIVRTQAFLMNHLSARLVLRRVSRPTNKCEKNVADICMRRCRPVRLRVIVIASVFFTGRTSPVRDLSVARQERGIFDPQLAPQQTWSQRKGYRESRQCNREEGNDRISPDGLRSWRGWSPVQCLRKGAPEWSMPEKQTPKCRVRLRR